MGIQTKNLVVSNIVKKDTLREVQQSTLSNIKDSLMNSAGPFGSTTGIIKNGQFTEYTKDGHTILENIQYNRTIENSIQKELTEITRYITVKVGDGTTSAVIMSSLIFDELCKIEKDNKFPPYKIIELFKEVVEEIKKLILNERRELNLEDVYNIAMICTNSNKEVSGVLHDIYKKHGLDVFIDVGVSTNHQNVIKTYDGLTLESGYSDPAYINSIENKDKKINEVENNNAGISIINNAEIYAFQDPIDTMEMTKFFQEIIWKNIMEPYDKYLKSQDPECFKEMIPTVIIAPKISIDNSSILTDLVGFLYKFSGDMLNAKPPILVITNVDGTQYDIYSDLWRLCGCTPIKKYIDHEIQKKEIEAGKAPTIETITNFAGHADEVRADAYKSTFINPKEMFVIDAEGNRNYSQAYSSQVAFIEQQLKVAQELDQDIDDIYNLKRRLHSLKANMIDYLVGGITVTDRDSVRALVEDAVKNIRSASQNGVGYGANYEGFRASVLCLSNHLDDEKELIIKVINSAYFKLSNMLYETAINNTSEAETKVLESLLNNRGPINLTNCEFDGKVLSTIDSDITILDIIAKIITVMFTTNQLLVPTPQHNMYINTDEI